ncbi:MAG: hypothetical protein PVH00_00225 [Gemmatimonadota bacterium]|jgi:GNAT superfamily N-acetyltransferase
MANANDVRLEIVGPDNLEGCGIGCVKDTTHEGFQPKVDWLRRRFEEGLRYFLCRDSGGKPLAFLEYVPGENAWRPVDAAGWLFVHCLWVYPRGRKYPGLGTQLIQACLEEARSAGTYGVAALVSEGPWMADRRVFLRNGFEVLAEADRFDLVAHRLSDGPDPRFRDIAGNLAKYRGLHIVYAPQCPYLPKSAADLAEVAVEHGLELNVTVLDTAEKAQCAPSHYGVFNLIWNGRLLADHYVSKTRFRNILRKEILPAP